MNRPLERRRDEEEGTERELGHEGMDSIDLYQDV
jgi:hypothetical protein